MAAAAVLTLGSSQDDEAGYPWSLSLRTIGQSQVKQEVNPDVYLATLYEISCSDEMAFETTHDGDIRINFASLTVLLSSSLVRNLQCSEEVSGRQVRYATIRPLPVEASHSTVWLSVWTPDYSGIENVYIRMEDLSTATRLLNALRRLRFITDAHDTIWLETFHPRIAAFYDVCVEPKSSTSETAPVFQPKFCVVDEEAFAVYDDVVDVSPTIMLRFQRELGDDVIEFMYMNRKTNMVKIVNDRLEVKVQRLQGAQREQGGRVDDRQTPHADREGQDDHSTQPQDGDQPVQETEPDVYMTTADFEKTVSHGRVTIGDQVAALQQVAAPVDQVSAPVDQVAAPVDQVAAPDDQVAAPVEQVAAPVDQLDDDERVRYETRTPVGDYDELLSVLKDIKCKRAVIFKDIEAYKTFFTKGSAVEGRETRTPTPPVMGRRFGRGLSGMEGDTAGVADTAVIEDIDDILPSDPDDVRVTLWAVAEVEMIQLIEDGLVPESTMISAGINPTSKDDFQKCIGEIQDAIFFGEYGQAVSYINGVREVFSPSLYNPRLTQLMDYDNTLKILKHIFFAADIVISMCQSPS